jgi:hypothetical protein
MNDDDVRARAIEVGDALVAGDVDGAISAFSEELRRNLGEVLALLPLPANEATVESVEHAGSGWNVLFRIAGETDEAEIQTRWKDRDGTPTIVEASHVSRTARPVPAEGIDGEAPEVNTPPPPATEAP